MLINLEPESQFSATTSLFGGQPFPGLELLNPLSAPAGNAFLFGDSLGFGGTGLFFDLGVGGLTVGQAAFQFPGFALPSGVTIRAQALYFAPSPATLLTLGLKATNPVALSAN
jgi:hypothetical protein